MAVTNDLPTGQICWQLVAAMNPEAGDQLAEGFPAHFGCAHFGCDDEQIRYFAVGMKSNTKADEDAVEMLNTMASPEWDMVLTDTLLLSRLVTELYDSAGDMWSKLALVIVRRRHIATVNWVIASSPLPPHNRSCGRGRIVLPLPVGVILCKSPARAKSLSLRISVLSSASCLIQRWSSNWPEIMLAFAKPGARPGQAPEDARSLRLFAGLETSA